MKKLSFLFIFLITFSAYSQDVYYCSDEYATGFDVADNYRQANYRGENFKMMIDFRRDDVIAKDLYFHGNKDLRQKCFSFDGILNCANDLGDMIIIDQKTLKFHRSNIFMAENQSDDIVLAYGYCEKF